MKKIIIYFSIVASIFAATGCTKEFNSLNKDPYKLDDDAINRDFLFIGGFFPQMEMNIYLYDGVQTEQNLTADAYAQYMVPPTPFAGNQNNVTYKYVWIGDQWNNSYNNTMAVVHDLVKNKKVKEVAPQFWAWSTVLKIFTMQKTTDYYGPIIYSSYGHADLNNFPYDDQKTIYYSFFAELDTAVNVLSQYADSSDVTSIKKFDLAYQGKISNWVKVANSLRLRLAVRISKVDPAKAKTEAEKAIAQKYGVIENVSDNFNVTSLKGHPLKMISFDWGDARMSATMESVLKGYKDPRLASDFSLSAEFPADYKGIRQGIDIKAKDTYIGYSPVGQRFKTANKLQIMTAAEVYFIRAEGVLRGWNMGGGTAQSYYEAGVKSSFDQLEVGGYDAYIKDDASTFANYVDTHNPTNNFSATSNVTIKWDEALPNEQKLEKIITQKWIAMFPEGQEAWAEFRRTGYPKLVPVVVNYSGGDINTNDFVRRVIYPSSEYDNNNAAVTAAAATLVGTNGIKGDKGGSRVWWDTGTPNF